LLLELARDEALDDDAFEAGLDEAFEDAEDFEEDPEDVRERLPAGGTTSWSLLVVAVASYEELWVCSIFRDDVASWAVVSPAGKRSRTSSGSSSKSSASSKASSKPASKASSSRASSRASSKSNQEDEPVVATEEAVEQELADEMIVKDVAEDFGTDPAAVAGSISVAGAHESIQ
jgi:hypothetical protein